MTDWRIQDHVGEYTTILNDSHLHTETIQKRLTPAIGKGGSRARARAENGGILPLTRCWSRQTDP
jgi:hypothetical protein